MRPSLPVRFIAVIAAFSALGLAPAPADAQFSIKPSVGLYSPLSDMTELRNEQGETVIEAGRRSSTLALGLGAELGGSERPVGLRLQLGYATNSDVPVSGVGCESCELRSSLLTATAGLVFRPFPELLVMRPHFVVGGGLKRYDFDRDDLEDEGWENVLRNQTQPALHLAVGTSLNLGVIRPDIELGAVISKVDGLSDDLEALTSSDDLQTDLFLMVAIPLLGG